MQIIKFSQQYTEKLIDLILNIQVNEFSIAITRNDQPDLADISGFYQVGKGNFWLAVDDDNTVIGTIGLIDIGNNQLALRKMFVDARFRGKNYGIAQSLLNTAWQWCQESQIDQVYLGTTVAYHAAHRFYEKNDFLEITKSELPLNFPVMAVDSKFYVKSFKSL